MTKTPRSSRNKPEITIITTVFTGLILVFGLFGCGGSSSGPALPTVSVASASMVEVDSGTANLVFTVSASTTSEEVITVNYSTTDGTATAGSDYSGVSDSVDISVGSTSATISVSVNGDADVEADETFTLTLNAVTNATLGTASATGTILNDDEDPTGFYDSGVAAVKLSDNTTDLSVTDLQGMVSGNRFMLVSVNEVLLYDGTITSITDNTYTATVNIYEDGVLLPNTAAVSGTINTASTLTGTLTGVGAGNGSFSLTYSLNNAASELVRIAGDWRGPLNGAATEIVDTTISNAGDISRIIDYLSSTPVLASCKINSGSTVLPIAGVNVYSVTITLSTCTNPAVDGDYTGFATTTTVADNELLLAYSNGSFSASGVLQPER